MTRIIKTLVVAVVVVTAAGYRSADAAPAGERLASRVLVSSPWVKDDTVGDADRPQGDVERVVVENARQQVIFTWRMAANPIWDTNANSLVTRMVFEIDWQATTAPYNRRLVVSRADGAWRQVIFNGAGNGICLRDGGVRVLPNHRFSVTVPTAMCLGGAHVIRVAAEFLDDHDPSAADDVTIDHVPNSGGYGPFIRLPN